MQPAPTIALHMSNVETIPGKTITASLGLVTGSGHEKAPSRVGRGLNAQKRTRTSTGFYSHQHLKLARLPIPPLALQGIGRGRITGSVPAVVRGQAKRRQLLDGRPVPRRSRFLQDGLGPAGRCLAHRAHLSQPGTDGVAHPRAAGPQAATPWSTVHTCERCTRSAQWHLRSCCWSAWMLGPGPGSIPMSHRRDDRMGHH